MNGSGGTNPNWYCYPVEGLHYNCVHKRRQKITSKAKKVYVAK